jgi:hypothetical protein
MAVTCGVARLPYIGNRKSQVRTLHMCPRTDMQLTYMINIALTAEFSLAADGAR